MRAGPSGSRALRGAVLLLTLAAGLALALRARRLVCADGGPAGEARGRILLELDRRARSPSTGAEAGELPIGPLDLQLARLFFPAIDKRMVYDPLVYSTLRPHHAYEMRLAEYPGGSFEMRTNSLGLREDGEPATEAPELRILVVGDSHTDGVVPNERSYANRLEALLAGERPQRSVEVLNAGVGGHSFHNYLGAPERWAALAPDLLVIGVYGGNDFAETMLLERYFHRRGPYQTGPWSVAPLLALEEVRPIGGILNQDLVEVVYFANNPEDVAVCVETALALSLELRRRCEARGMGLLFLYIPPATRGQPERFADHARVARDKLGLTDTQLGVSDRLADRWLAGLAEAGVDAIDLRPALRDSVKYCYWRLDLHISLAGHELAAQALFERLSGR